MRDVTDPELRAEALNAAAGVVRRGGLVVLPTDTVYGIGVDAFFATGVAALLAAKGRGRTQPPPVLISDGRAVLGLARELSAGAQALTEAFWPGPLTLVVDAQPGLAWDLGDTGGTVALRVPDHEVARALLQRTGPMAVSSANLSGAPPATTAADARAQLGARVELYLDAGPTPGSAPSTIVDARTLQVLRRGVLDLAALREVADVTDLLDGPDGDVTDGDTDGPDGDATDGPEAGDGPSEEAG
ncbi:MAG: L-threonylcarbamoyladenylate synthase [Micrococcales bacterium]|nr:L-threonylcarbamoyladenylate synthase [Micrococcales bacterium]MCL2668173.1 L-threonylcarbamoyladenylate synthase [Micrococcales bacterium]